jgi:hypothetical protein
VNERHYDTGRVILFYCTCILSIRTIIKYIHKVREAPEYQFENVFDILGSHSSVAGDVKTFRLAHSSWHLKHSLFFANRHGTAAQIILIFCLEDISAPFKSMPP